MSVSTKFKINKVPQILKEISKMKKSYVSVGVHEKAKDYSNGASVQMIARVHEFGSTNTPYPIPERSFLRSTYDENEAKIGNDLKNSLWDITNGKTTAKKELSKIGFEIREKTKTKIEKLKDPPNAESTAKQKGFDNPLIRTRHLKNSIDFEVHIK